MPRVPPSQGQRPKLGQHFLTDPGATKQIVEALGDISQRTVLEIGPGRGALTSLLAARARRVIAVELDRVLSAQLRMKLAALPNLEILEADVLTIDFDSLFGPKPGSSRPGIEIRPEPVHVIGNLPYYITSELLLRLFEYRHYFDQMVLMVQREVAVRMAASPGSRDYGLLSATVQLYASIEELFTLPPDAFSPPPKVDSTVVRLTMAPRVDSLQVPEEQFIRFLRLSFGHKRKTLWNNLKDEYRPEVLKNALKKTEVKPAVRAEALSLEKSAEIFRELLANSGS